MPAYSKQSVKYIDLTRICSELERCAEQSLSIESIHINIVLNQKNLNKVYTAQPLSANLINICTMNQKLTSNSNMTGPVSVNQRLLTISTFPKI